MGTGLKIDVKARPGTPGAGALERHNLGMVLFLVEVIPLTHDLPVLDNYCSHQRIRADSTHPPAGQSDGPLHEPFVPGFGIVSQFHPALFY